MMSCSTILNNLPGVYSLEIQQGNIISQAMIDQLRPGMSKRQVIYIMGSPMLDNFFHKNRWDFLYSAHPTGGEKIQQQISLFFDNDQIVGIQGDFRPSTTPIPLVSNESTVDIPKRDLDKTLWEKITGLLGISNLDATSTSKSSATQNSSLNSSNH
jgi:outer membrane protein assembly factor BamE